MDDSLRIEPGVRYRSETGAWAVLDADATAGRAPGGVSRPIWFVRGWAPHLARGIRYDNFGHSSDRARVERALQAWLIRY